ncbi:MAG: hypothetical protein M3328_09720 [Chloroflexota bacterium]|nr:hypothetical protein [Chloroflexota bacterium]
MRGKQSVEMSLAGEIRGLRASLRLMRKKMRGDEEDLAKMGPVVARLTDSVARALLAQSKLVGEGDGTRRLHSETDRLLEEFGIGNYEL